MLLHSHYLVFLSFYFFIYKNTPGGSEVKVSACNVGDLSSIPGLGRSPGEGNGKTLQYSSPENPMDRGAWWATVHGVAKSWTWLSWTLSLSITVALQNNQSSLRLYRDHLCWAQCFAHVAFKDPLTTIILLSLKCLRDFPDGLWLRLLPMHRVCAQSLVREQIPHIPHSQKKQNISNRSNNVTNAIKTLKNGPHKKKVFKKINGWDLLCRTFGKKWIFFK